MNSYNSPFRDEAVQFISIGKDGKLQINPEAVNILNAIQGPISVIGVAGQYRTGKSYLLNKILLNFQNGFQVGPTVNPCTKGIWIWGRPLTGKSSDDKSVNVIIMDSEGLGAIDEDNAHDARIFALVLLLSSCFLYNSMGVIDEQALEGLGLIVDLTKTIKLRAGNNLETTAEDYAEYMPFFVWIVRDFSFELVDTQNKELTSNEYLEMALAEQRGFSDSVEEKNRIRRLVKAFFPDRKCVTMVRPAIDESVLRSLEKAGPEALRPEFQEQCLSLRKLLVRSSRVKSLSGSELSGDMLSGLAQAFISAINERRVPVIESCWTYLCRERSQKAVEQSLEVYSQEMNSSFTQAWPLPQPTLQALHRDAESMAIKEFQSLIVGEDSEAFRGQLMEELGRRLSLATEENRNCFHVGFKRVLVDEYRQGLGSKMANGQVSSFSEFEKEIREFERLILEREIDGPDRPTILSEFLQKKILEAGHLLVNKVKISTEERIKESQREFTKTEERLREQISLNEKTKRQTEGKNNELLEELKMCKERVKKAEEMILQTRSSHEEEKGKEQAKSMDQMKRTEETIRGLREETERCKERARKCEMEVVNIQSKADEERGLLTQKLTFLEDRLKTESFLNEGRARELTLAEESHSTRVKELMEKLEGDLKQREAVIRQLKDANFELEERLDRGKLESDKVRNDLSAKVTTLAQKLKDSERSLAEEISKNQKNSSVKDLSDTGMSLMAQEQLNLQIQNYQNEISLLTERLTSQKHSFECEKSVLQQRNKLLQSTVDELRAKADEATQMFNSAFTAFDNSTDTEKMDLSRQLSETTERHKLELRNAEKHAEEIRSELTRRVTVLEEELDHLREEKETLYIEETKKRKLMQERLSALEESCTYLKNQLSTKDAESRDYIETIESEWQDKVARVEEELRNSRSDMLREVNENNRVRDEELKKLRDLFQAEQQRNSAILNEERERAEARVVKVRKELEERLANETSNHEEELTIISNDLNNRLISENSKVQGLEAECRRKDEQVEQLQMSFKTISSEHQELQKKLREGKEAAEASMIEEMNELRLTMEGLRREKEGVSNELFESKNLVNSLRVDLNRVNELAGLSAKTSEREQDRLREEGLELREKLEKVTEESIKLKADLSQSLALSKQSEEFFSNVKTELTRQLEQCTKRFEEKMTALRSDHDADTSSVRQRAAEEIATLESKFEVKRKAMKDVERGLQEQVTALEARLAKISEKLNSVTEEYERVTLGSQKEKAELLSKIEELSSQSSHVNASLGQKIEDLKKEKYKYEMGFAELQATLDKEKALSRNQIEFLEDQREQLRKEKEGIQKNFELIMQKFHKAKMSEREENTASQSIIMANAESQYNSKLAELMERTRSEKTLLNEKITKMEKEYKLLGEKLLRLTNSESEARAELQKKENEKAELQKRLSDQILAIKSEKDARLSVSQKKFEDEISKYAQLSEEYKQKVAEVEKNLMKKDYQIQINQTTWSNEKDFLERAKNGYLSRLQELEKEKERLIKENESFKSELKRIRLLAPETISKSRVSIRAVNLADRSFVLDSDRSLINKRADKDRSFITGDNLSESDSQADRLLKDLRDPL